MKNKKLKLTFVSGVTTVTGANFLLENIPEEGEEHVQILIDCGLEQGTSDADEHNVTSFSFDPKKVNYLLVTHAHIDHVGRIPKLVRDGFNGKIFSTPETRKLAPLLLEDSGRLLAREAERKNIPPLYSMEDITNTMKLWHDVPYHVKTDLKEGLSFVMKDAGHILGSAMYEISFNGKKIVFTGDLGNSPTPLLKDTEMITDATYMVMESVYGDRNHELKDERRSKLEDVIEDVWSAKGTLLIPSFSLEKTQVLLHEINSLVEESRVPAMPVFLDSPLAIKITAIYKEYTKNFNDEVKKEIGEGDDIFNFPRLTIVNSAEESKKLINVPGPKIIIAGSGMSTGGRIIHHEANYLPDSKNTILLIGYQTTGTLGRRIQNGEKSVRILGENVPVNAKVVTINGYSSHKDGDHLLEFVSNSGDTLKKVFPVMGEPKSAMFLAQRIRDNLAIEAIHPNDGEEVILDF